ncbi:MAG: hypothetical protein Q9178_002313 [Gyalolechia marmorata]
MALGLRLLFPIKVIKFIGRGTAGDGTFVIVRSLGGQQWGCLIEEIKRRLAAGVGFAEPDRPICNSFDNLRFGSLESIQKLVGIPGVNGRSVMKGRIE